VLAEFAQGDEEFFLPGCGSKNVHVERFLDLLGQQDRLGLACVISEIRAEEQDLVAVLGCQIDVMRYGDDRFALLELGGFEQVVYANLMFQVQKACRLIQEKDGAVLGKCSCDEDPLSFAAAQACERP